MMVIQYDIFGSAQLNMEIGWLSFLFAQRLQWSKHVFSLTLTGDALHLLQLTRHEVKHLNVFQAGENSQ